METGRGLCTDHKGIQRMIWKRLVAGKSPIHTYIPSGNPIHTDVEQINPTLKPILLVFGHKSFHQRWVVEYKYGISLDASKKHTQEVIYTNSLKKCLW